MQPHRRKNVLRLPLTITLTWALATPGKRSVCVDDSETANMDEGVKEA